MKNRIEHWTVYRVQEIYDQYENTVERPLTVKTHDMCFQHAMRSTSIRLADRIHDYNLIMIGLVQR